MKDLIKAMFLVLMTKSVYTIITMKYTRC